MLYFTLTLPKIFEAFQFLNSHSKYLFNARPLWQLAHWFSIKIFQSQFEFALIAVLSNFASLELVQPLHFFMLRQIPFLICFPPPSSRHFDMMRVIWVIQLKKIILLRLIYTYILNFLNLSFHLVIFDKLPPFFPIKHHQSLIHHPLGLVVHS